MVGFGGYPVFPPFIAARMLGKNPRHPPRAEERHHGPGLTGRWSSRATGIALSFAPHAERAEAFSGKIGRHRQSGAGQCPCRGSRRRYVPFDEDGLIEIVVVRRQSGRKSIFGFPCPRHRGLARGAATAPSSGPAGACRRSGPRRRGVSCGRCLGRAPTLLHRLAARLEPGTSCDLAIGGGHRRHRAIDSPRARAGRPYVLPAGLDRCRSAQERAGRRGRRRWLDCGTGHHFATFARQSLGLTSG